MSMTQISSKGISVVKDPLKSIWKWLTVALMIFVIYGAFFIAKGASGFANNGDAARIVFFHVPAAVTTLSCYIAAAIYAVRYLWFGRKLDTDAKSAVAMELGLLVSVLATVTGSIFAQAQWNSYWNWDPREVSIVGALLLYSSYLLLRGTIGDNPSKRAQLSGAYAIITLVPAVLLLYVVPKVPALQSLHPVDVLIDATKTSASYRIVLDSGIIAFSMLTVWMFQLRLRVIRMQMRRSAVL